MERSGGEWVIFRSAYRELSKKDRRRVNRQLRRGQLRIANQRDIDEVGRALRSGVYGVYVGFQFVESA